MSRAEAAMRTTYPKRFRLSGFIELQYLDFALETDGAGLAEEDRTSIFTQRYSLGLQGYIYDPRLAIFSTRVTYNEDRSWREDDQVSKSLRRDLDYDISATFLPYRPISLDITALKTDTMVESSTVAPVAASALSYGATLKIALRNKPLIRLIYSHFESSSADDANGNETKGDWYNLDVRGYISAIRTRYFLVLAYADFFANGTANSSKNISFDSGTSFKTGQILRTSFTYAETGPSNFMRFSTDVEFSPLKRFRQRYEYTFDRSEEDTFESNVHRTTGRWAYRISDNLFAGASAQFGAGNENAGDSEVSGWSYSVGANASYNKPLTWLIARAHYAFAHSGIRNTLSDDFGEERDKKAQTVHSIGFNVMTKKLKVATAFARYNLFVFNSDEEASLAQSFSSGVAGRGPGRAHWKLSADAQFSKSSTELLDPETDETVVISGNSYGLRAEVGYPFQQGGSVSLSGGYTASETDGSDTKGYYYDLRVFKKIVKNLTFAAWWRETQNSILESGTEIHSRDFDVSLFYKIGNMYFSLDFRYFIQTQASVSTRARSVAFTVRRNL